MSYTIMAGRMHNHGDRDCCAFIDTPLANRLSINMTGGNLAALLKLVGAPVDWEGPSHISGDELRDAYFKACELRGIDRVSGEIENFEVFYDDTLLDEYHTHRLDQFITLAAYAREVDGMLYWA